MELCPKPILRHRTRSLKLDQTLPYIGELMKYGQITLGNVRPVGCVAVAHDGRQTVSILLRREGETVTQLLTRLDVAIAKALTKGICTDEVNPINQQYFPKNKCPLPILGGHFRTQTRCQMRSQTNAYFLPLECIQLWRKASDFPRPPTTPCAQPVESFISRLR